MSSLQIRIDEETKTMAKKIFAELGLDLSSGIKMYLKQVIIRKGIPFPVITENGFTLEEEKRLLASIKEAENEDNLIGPFESAEEVIKALKNYEDPSE